MVKEIQRINPVGLYDPSPNGYTHVAMVASRTAFDAVAVIPNS